MGWLHRPPRNRINGCFCTGEDTRTLERLGNEVQRVVGALPDVISVESDMEEEGGREIRLEVDRRAADRYDISPERIGQTVGFALRSNPLPDFQDGDKQVEVVSRFRWEDRQDLNQLLDFPMWSQHHGSVVPLRSLANVDFAQGLGSIRRENRITSYPISIDLQKGVSNTNAWTNIEGALTNMQLPEGYTWSRTWNSEVDEVEENARILMALGLSITFVFLIMGVLFESFLLPMSIITTIPMAFLGVYWTLYLTGTPFDTMGAVGLVILVGVVVNNGIVYIDLVTRLRNEGTERITALVEAGTRRLRPILMTALTTIFGLLPMAVGDSSFIGMPYSPLGRVVSGGLATGTLLTLFLLPFLYTYWTICEIQPESGWPTLSANGRKLPYESAAHHHQHPARIRAQGHPL